jgi:hypothetical protein
VEEVAMRQGSLAGLWLAFLVPVVFACGATAGTQAPAASPGTQSCGGVKGAHHSWVVVQHLSGAVVRKCAGYDVAQEGGEDLLKASGIEYQGQTFGSLGLALCQVDKEPPTFDKCLPANAPYWAVWISRAGATWTQPDTGLSGLQFSDHDALGLRYTQPTDPSPAPPPQPPKE